MMLIPPPGDSNAVFALLNAISDPAAAKQNLADISKASADLEVKMQDFQNLSNQQKALEDAQTQLKADIASLESIKEIQLKSISDSKTNLDSQQAQLNSDLSTLTVSQNKFNQDTATKTALLDAREADLLKRESAVEGNIANTAIELSKAQALKNDYINKLNALKALTN